jgi:hypothetical protein
MGVICSITTRGKSCFMSDIGGLGAKDPVKDREASSHARKASSRRETPRLRATGPAVFAVGSSSFGTHTYA